jgi:hypothetical protein
MSENHRLTFHLLKLLKFFKLQNLFEMEDKLKNFVLNSKKLSKSFQQSKNKINNPNRIRAYGRFVRYFIVPNQ